jgi:quinol monooxygenase YgiN
MTYIRVSTMVPVAGREDEATQVNQELVAFYRSQPGCLDSHYVTAADSSGEQGRVSFWASERAADTAANQERSLYLRSRLHLLVRHGHQERSFTSEGEGVTPLAEATA